ncbi:MAG: hypothetical protein ABJN57_00925 [Hyphomicrobiales bacterium]
MSLLYLSKDEEEAVLELIRIEAGSKIIKSYTTNDDLKQARLFHDLKIYGDAAFELYIFLIEIVAIDPKALPAEDDRPYFPPEFYSVIPFVDVFKKLRDKKENYYPLTVQELLDACRSPGSPDTLPDNISSSVAGKIMCKWL